MLPTRRVPFLVGLAAALTHINGSAVAAAVESSVQVSAVCPAAADLPQLTIDDVRESPLPVIDRWQVFWGGAPLSDVQLALLSGQDPVIDRTTAEIRARGSRVFLGMAAAALGTALSSTGWILFGQDKLDEGVTLSIAIGGLLLGIGSVLFVTESIQTPLEPLLAPTPVHRLTRDEAHELVVRVNTKLYRDICAGVAKHLG